MTSLDDTARVRQGIAQEKRAFNRVQAEDMRRQKETGDGQESEDLASVVAGRHQLVRQNDQHEERSAVVFFEQTFQALRREPLSKND